MKHCLLILLIFLTAVTTVNAQRSGRQERGSFSISNLSGANREIPDSLLVSDSLRTENIIGYHLTQLGDPYVARMDTNRLNSSNNTLVEAQSAAVGYLSNIGSPAQTRIFNERKEARDFIFADGFDYYIPTPLNVYYYDTKDPYTHVTYSTSGSAQNKDDRLKGVLTTNFGKQVNIGADLDYIYSRGHYNSNGNKLLTYRLFGSYRSDKYELFAYLSNYNFVNYENGGLSDDNYLLDPENYQTGKQTVNTKEYPTRIYDTWNRVRGKQYFVTHRYNLGFYRDTGETDEEGDEIEQFIPVSSIIHTLDYEDNRRHFTSKMDTIDRVYENLYGLDSSVSDRTSMWNLKNTVALSLREGFQDWVKFGLSAYLRLEKRRYKLPAKVPGLDYDGEDETWKVPTTLNYKRDDIYDEFSTYVGAELFRRQGKLFKFNARGELGIIGDDVGELRVDGDIQSTFRLLGKDASVKAIGAIHNVTPAFYQRHNHSRYFWWDNNLSKTQTIKAGGEVDIASTRTNLYAGLHSIQNYVYFDSQGLPKQHDSNIQVVTARLKQDLKYRAFGWENEVVYQLSSDQDVLPLPTASLHSNIYIHFKLFKVLTFQLGGELYYNTKYYAPYYEPATQQFQLQWDDDNRIDKKIKVGNYPLLNGYLNMHLKQARFFIMGYNLSSLFVDPTYFSLPHYPLNPMVLKLGVSVYFNN